MVNLEPQAYTVGERIVAYLEQLSVNELTTKDPWPVDATQDGIAATLGLSRAHVALELQRLLGKRLVEGLKAHVQPDGTRRKVYRALDERRHGVYTPEGERVPLARGTVRELRVVFLRCPSCGKESRVALDE